MIMLSDKKIAAAVEYNKDKRYSIDCWKQIQTEIGASPDGDPGKKTAAAVAKFQDIFDLSVDGKVGPGTLSTLGVSPAFRIPSSFSPVFPEAKQVEMSDALADRLVEITAEFESKGNYGACNKDGEYEGKFDRGEKLHRASKHGKTPVHIGLSWGYIQFTQDGGTLGKVLKKAYNKDKDQFFAVFGKDSDELIKVVTATGKSGLRSGKLRGPRVKKVAGADLWKEPWLARFRAAGKMELFKWAQRQAAIDGYFMPAFEHALSVNLNSERGIVMLFDRAVQLGKGGMRKLLTRAHVGSADPFDDPVLEIYQQLEKLEAYTRKYRWHHRMEKLLEVSALRDHVLAVKE